MASKLFKLPRPFQFLVLLCLSLPVFSLIFLDSPLQLISDHRFLGASTLVISYWVLPLTLALTTLRTGTVLVPVYFGQSIALLFHTAVMHYEPRVALIQLAALSVMICLGLIFTRKDYLVPLIWTQERGFRGAKRHHRQSPLKLVNPKSLEAVDVVMENFSMTGLRVVGNLSLDRFLQTLAEDKAQLVFRDRQSEDERVIDIDVEIVWHRNLGPVSYCGMAANEPEMFALISSVAASSGPGNVWNQISHAWQRPSTRQVFLAVWSVAIIVAVAVPACSRTDPETFDLSTDRDSLTKAECIDSKDN